MPQKRLPTPRSTIDPAARDQFYAHANGHIDSLNPKFRNKAVVTRELSVKIINALQNKSSSEKDHVRFSRWCRQTFLLRWIGGHQVLCDIKNMKPVLLFEDMYKVYFDSHHQTAHSGRDKCMEYISANYSWSNRSLLQIFSSQCSACQTRKSIKIPSVTKPIIALGISILSQCSRALFPSVIVSSIRERERERETDTEDERNLDNDKLGIVDVLKSSSGRSARSLSVYLSGDLSIT
jgi:hypothetical protein